MRTLLFLCSLSFAFSLSAEDKPFESQLLEAAANYQKFHRVDDQIHVAPTLCNEPRTSMSVPRLSSSGDEATHGKKLYYLFAKNRNEYWNAEKQTTQPIGQAIIKEAWSAETTDASKFQDPHDTRPGNALPHDGKFLAPGTLKALFILLKLDPKTGGTDQGWVYATLAPDGKSVTASGKIASCMKCHEEAQHDRLFGLPKPTDKK